MVLATTSISAMPVLSVLMLLLAKRLVSLLQGGPTVFGDKLLLLLQKLIRALRESYHLQLFKFSMRWQLQQMAKRSSVSYQPSTWSHDFVESLKGDLPEKYRQGHKELKALVKVMIDEEMEPLALLELVDNIQRLGLGYQFEKDIKQALQRIVSFQPSNEGGDRSLHATALSFRLLRQHGYDVCQDVFKHFMDHNGNFKACLGSDVKGMLSLYEASYLAFGGENILHEAKAFASVNLRHHVGKMKPYLDEQVSHALDLPLQRKMLRLEAREHIEAYLCGRMEDANCVLLELAVMDFNIVQALHQRELQVMSRWWRDTGLAKKLGFIRDRITEAFFCSIGLVFEPKFSNCRKRLTQVIALISTIDDVYDIYGSMEELEQFTNAIGRWNMDGVEKLSDSLQLCFLVLLSTINEMACTNLKEQGVNTISHLKKAWADLCKSFLIEAKWHHTKYTPTFKEYLDNAWVSSSGVVLLVHSYCLISQNITKESLYSFDEHNGVVYPPSLIFRLCNDLVSPRVEWEGDETAKSIPCYMHETGFSEESACEDMRNLIDETWKKINENRIDNTRFCEQFMDIILNLARTVHCVYQHGDSYGTPHNTSRTRVRKLLIEPVSWLFNE